MPFELGLDFGCMKFRENHFQETVFLVLEEQKYRYKIALSDLAGYELNLIVVNTKLPLVRFANG